MPRGVPELPKLRTLRQVKSGFKKESFSNSAGQGINFKNSGTLETK